MKKRLLSAAMALCLAFSLLGQAAQARETSFFSTFPEPVPQQAMQWRAAEESYGEFDAARQRLFDALESGKSAQVVLFLCTGMMNVFQKLKMEYTFCYLDYCRQPERWSEDYLAWTSVLNQAQDEVYTALRQALESELGPELAQEMGEEVAAGLLAYASLDEAQQALLEQENALVNEYWSIMNGGLDAYCVQVDGRTWTLAQASEDTALDEQTREEILYTLQNEQYRQAAQVLAQLVPIRNQYARSMGYDSYANYAYEQLYARDYTPQEAQRLYGAVKAALPEMIQWLALAAEHNPELQKGRLDGMSGLSQEEILALAAPVIEEISSEYDALLDYMVDNQLCDLNQYDTQLAVGFTTELPLYHAAYLYNAPYGAYPDVSTFFHEFGHFSHFCLADIPTSAYDLCEIHSQGLEALSLAYAEQLAGEEGGDAYRLQVLYGLIGVVLDGCLYDEFQQVIYERGDMTAGEMAELFTQLAGAYGYFYDGPSYDWVQVNHTFEQPFYYISYATSALTALELLADSSQDFDTWADAYLALVARSDGAGYQQTVTEASFSNPFEAGSVEQIADGIRDYMEDEIFDLPAFPDLEGHWSQGAALLCASCGWFQGDHTGAFLPESTLNRGELVTLLWRVAGSPEEAEPAGFADVPTGAWYAQAANWAAGMGMLPAGASFGAAAPVTREELAAMLWMLLGAPETEETLASYRDANQVSDWALQAMSWAVETGLLQGKSADQLVPQGQLTRAEAAQVLSRLLWV